MLYFDFEDRREFCKFLNLIKFPNGYATNISRNVNISDRKILGLKSRDCHVLLQRLLHISIQTHLNKDMYTAIVELMDSSKIYVVRHCTSLTYKD